MSDSENARHQRFLAAAKRFESGEISYGKAAASAGMSKIDFIEMCGVYRISMFNYKDEEIARELKEEMATIEKIETQRT